MKQKYPWWLWVLCAISLWPVLMSPLFIFGSVFPFDAPENVFEKIIQRIITNLPWIIPVFASFKSFDLYRRGWELRAAVIAVVTSAATLYLAYYLIY